ncbi:ABC transporter ATP-binding protein [Burkholderiaceae bacterium DAT-1]|nr:ABC transporter ATP-binding protein [Burkholderiaceae bacterium DAT-1]
MLSQLKQTPKGALIGYGLFAVAVAIAPWVIGAGFGNTWVRNIDMVLLYVMLAVGLNIVVGYAGLLDLGYIAFYAVGAYVYALLNSPHLTPLLEGTILMGLLHPPLWVSVLIGAALAALFGVLLGSPTLKLRGDYLAIVTLGFGEIIRLFMNNLDRPVNITNGPQGINMVEPVSLFGHQLSDAITIGGFEIKQLYLYYYLFLALVSVVVMVSIRLQHSRIGRAWVAIREDEIAANAMGINTRNVKLLAFAMGASFGGISGTMFAGFQGFVSPESFTLMESIMILAMVVLGGMGHVPGVIVGALLLFATPEVLRDIADPLQDKLLGQRLINPENLRMLLFGIALVVMMLVRPEGIWPSKRRKAEFHEGDAKAARDLEKEKASV